MSTLKSLGDFGRFGGVNMRWYFDTGRRASGLAACASVACLCCSGFCAAVVATELRKWATRTPKFGGPALAAQAPSKLCGVLQTHICFAKELRQALIVLTLVVQLNQGRA